LANSTSHVLPYPIKNARFTLPISFRVSAGTPTDPTTPDTEFSSDGGATFADCAEEITTGGTNGMGYLTLTGAETNNNFLWIAGKSANDLTSPVAVVPRVLAIVGSGTLSAGSAGGGTLGTILAYDVTGCFIRTTGGTGGGGTGGANNQARRIITYTVSTGAFTVSPNWETTPSTDTTYDVLLPEGVTLGMLKALNPTTAGRTLVVDASGLADANTVKVGPTGSGTAQTARDIGASVLLSSGTGTGQLDFTSGVVKSNLTQITGNTSGPTNLNTIFNTDYATVYDTTNKAFLAKLGNFAMGGSSLALTTGAISGTTLTLSGAVAFQSTFIVTGATTFTGAVTASNASNNIVGIDVAKLGGGAQSLTDLKDFADTGYDPATHKVAGVVLVDTTTANTDMRGTNGAMLAYTQPSGFLAATFPTDPADQSLVIAATDAIMASVAALSIPTANQNAAAVLDLAAGVETGLTLRQAVRLIVAAAAGKLSGAATTTIVIRNAVADSKDRITATVDASGNRSAITVDLS
jgi:hypothetical protein